MAETWLVAHDFSPCSDAAAFEAARLLSGLQGTLRLFHIYPPVQLPAQEAWGETTYNMERELRGRLDRLAALLRDKHPNVTVQVEVAAGEPVAGILSEAERDGVDHIVVGTHGRTGMAHLVLGSVAERVVREAKMPVLVVKTKG
jgi:nucleotide-binding universal stress UspA family protein